MTIAAQRYQQPRSQSHVGQAVPIPSQPAQPSAPGPLRTLAQETQQARSRELLDEFREGFKAITPELIATGLVIGVLSGVGSTIGAAIGTFLVQALNPASRPSRRRR